MGASEGHTDTLTDSGRFDLTLCWYQKLKRMDHCAERLTGVWSCVCFCYGFCSYVVKVPRVKNNYGDKHTHTQKPLVNCICV